MKGWEEVNRIKAHLSEGKKVTWIARSLGIDRKTVRKYRDKEMEEIAKQIKMKRRPSEEEKRFTAWVEQKILEMRAEGLINAKVVHQELVKMGYQGSARTIRRWIEGKREKGKRRVYKPFETRPGQQAQVDFGEKRMRRNGQQVSVHFAAIILGHSRMKYVAFYDRALDTEMFLNFHREAFAYFGGMPGEIVYDQTKLAVLKETYGEVEFNEAFYRFATWYGFKPIICHARDPESKGKIEAVVKYVKSNFLLTRQWESFRDLNRQGMEWLDEVANAKPHEITGRPPKESWAEELPLLKKVPEGELGVKPALRTQQVYQDGLVKVLGNRYSAPQAFHGQWIKVRVSEERVELYDASGNPVWSHWRAEGKSKRVMESSHYEKTYQIPTASLANKVSELYGSRGVVDWIERKYPRHQREQFKNLIRLAENHPQTILHEAARITLRFQCSSYLNLKRTVENLVASGAIVPPQVGICDGQLELELGLEVRPAAYYDEAVSS
jgi:transposase